MTDLSEKARRLEEAIASAERDIARRQENVEQMRTELKHLQSPRPVELTFDWSAPDQHGDRTLRVGIYSGVVQLMSDGYIWATYFGSEEDYFGDGEAPAEAEAMRAAEAAIREHAEGNA